MARATEFTVSLEDKPGTLADVAQALGKAGVNIDGFQGTTIGGEGVVSLVTNNPDAAKKALEEAGFKSSSREVLVVKLDDRPGSLGTLARALAQAGVNLNGGYITMGGTVVLGVSDMEAAEKVAGDQGAL
jgi:hypothetical protein